MSGITTLIIIAAAMACTLGGVSLLAYVYNLNHIKSKTVGDGQHGTARWASSGEIKKTWFEAGGCRCRKTVEAAAEVLEAYLKK